MPAATQLRSRAKTVIGAGITARPQLDNAGNIGIGSPQQQQQPQPQELVGKWSPIPARALATGFAYAAIAGRRRARGNILLLRTVVLAAAPRVFFGFSPRCLFGFVALRVMIFERGRLRARGLEIGMGLRARKNEWEGVLGGI